MNAQKLTQKSMEAIHAAQSVAIQYQNMQIDQVHLLYALADQEGGLISQLLTKMNVEPARFIQACETEIARIPKVTGSGREPDKVYITPDLDAALTEAEQTAARMKDDYVSVEHVFLALMDKANAGAKRVFESCGIKKNDFLKEMQAVRGNTRVTSDQPEETYDVLNKYGQELVELARKQKLDPVIGRDSEIRNVIRILLRKTKNNPVLIGEPGVGKTAIAEGLAQLKREHLRSIRKPLPAHVQGLRRRQRAAFSTTHRREGQQHLRATKAHGRRPAAHDTGTVRRAGRKGPALPLEKDSGQGLDRGLHRHGERLGDREPRYHKDVRPHIQL